LFDPNLAKKPQVVVINKTDLDETKEKLSKVKSSFKRKGIEVMTISALARTDLTPVLWKAKELLDVAPPADPVADMPVYRPVDDGTSFEVSREEGGWRVVGKAIERAADMTYWDMDESVRRFQRLMERLGVDEALRKAGVQEGESVFIGENEFEWQE
jgi:GTPase